MNLRCKPTGMKPMREPTTSWKAIVMERPRAVALALGVLAVLVGASQEARGEETEEELFKPMFYSTDVDDSVLLLTRHLETLNGEDWLKPPQRYFGDELGTDRLERFEAGVRRRLALKGVVTQIANAPKDARFFHLFNPLAPPEYFGPDPSLRKPTEHSFDFNVFGDATLSGQLKENGR